MSIELYVVIILILAIPALIFWKTVWFISDRLFAPWVPSRFCDLERIAVLLDLSKDDKFVELGSGDGRLIAHLSRVGSGHLLGIEINPLLYLWASIKAVKNKAKFKCKSLFMENLTEADAVFFFGINNRSMYKLKRKLLDELKPGSRIVSYAFPIPGLAPASVSRPTDRDLPIYLYVV